MAWRSVGAVGALAIAGLSSALGAAETTPADLVVEHANVYTVDPSKPAAPAFAVKDGRIVAVGTDAEIERLAGAKTARIDLGGKFVLPGFIDSHTHIFDGGSYLSIVRLRDAPTLAEVQKRVAAYAKAHPDKTWILGEAWSYGYPDMPAGEPTRQMLDAVAPDRPVLLNSGMAHAAWANSRALELLGITAQTKNPPSGEIVRDGSGSPTGWLKESASTIAGDAVPKSARPSFADAFSAAMKEAGQVGVTRLVSAGGDWDALPLLRDWEKQGKLTTRFSISEWQLSADVPKDFFDRLERGRQNYHSDWVRTGAIKLFADGVIESHTAFLPEGYSDRPAEKGVNDWPPEQEKALVAEANRRGFQVYIHAIGDGGIHQALDAYEASANAGYAKDMRNRIEHFEDPYPADIDRLVKLGVVASMQPDMIYPKDQWLGMAGLWQKYAGDERMKHAFPIASVLAKGGRVAFGTDWPIIDLNPLLGIRNAVLRRSLDGEPAGGWVPSERITVEQAIRAYTLDAAWACHRDRDEGSISVGKLADFIVLSDDLTRIDPDKIASAKVLATYVAGKQVYRREP